jgi:hypothetical protein
MAPSTPPSLTARREAAIVAASVAVFVALSWFAVARVPYPYFDDVDFLDLGNRIRSAGGPPALLRDLFTGRFTEANRHPLYLAILALFARPALSYHRDGQVLAVALGLLAVLACWWVARRHFGRGAGAIVAVMLSVSGALVWTACRECADALLVAFWALGVGALLDGAREGERSAKGIRAFALAGVWAGLAYLTKGPGLFLPICLGITLLVQRRLRALRDVRAWGFAVAFLVTSLPLLWRNLKVYGSPLYNLNGKYFWVDRLPDFAEVFAPHADARLPHGAREYLAQATPGSIAWRAGMGLAETVFHLGDSMAVVAPWPGSVIHVVWVVSGVISTLAAVRLLWRREPGFLRTFMLVQCGWWFAFLVFYSAISGASRYFLPLVTTAIMPTLAAFLAAALDRAGSFLRSRWATGIAALAAVSVASTLAFDPTPTRPPAGFLELQDWMIHTLGESDVYAVDARTHFQPRWLLPGARQVIVSASWKSLPVPVDEMVRYLCEQRVRYVVLDAEAETTSVEPGATRSRYLFYDRLPRGPDGSLPLQGFPAGMRPVYVGAESPRRWMVLETSCAVAWPAVAHRD